jgi:MFS family permease
MDFKMTASNEGSASTVPSADKEILEYDASSQAGSETTPLMVKYEFRRISSVWATARLVLTVGAGMFADGWDLQVMNLVLSLTEAVYPAEMTPVARAQAASMTMVGVVIGQLFFGALSDTLGHRNTSLLTSMITVISMIASGCITNTGMGIAMSLAVCRLFCGFGIGGEYPVTANLSRSIDGSKLCMDRVQFLCVNMAMFNLGGIAQAALALV